MFVRLVCPRRCFRHSVVSGNSAGIAPSIAPYNRVMARSLIWVALMAIVTALYPSGAFGEFVCGPTPRTCAVFLNAKAMFRGRVIAVDRRLGLVRIRVEERFKGVANETQEVWIDPKWTGPGGFIEDPGPTTGREKTGSLLPQPSTLNPGRNVFRSPLSMSPGGNSTQTILFVRTPVRAARTHPRSIRYYRSYVHTGMESRWPAIVAGDTQQLAPN